MIRDAAPLLLTAWLAGCAAGGPTTDARTGEARSADGVAIRYDIRGSGEPALVLVHGWTNDRGVWGQHLTTLAETHRVVALDLAGHGVSGADRSDWTMEAFGDDVVAVVDQLELDRVVLVGFSMGGGVAVEAADRLGDRVLGIVFVDTFHDPEFRLSEEDAERMIAGFRANWGDTAFLRAFAYTPDAPDSLIRRTHERMPAEPREHWFDIFRGIRAWIASDFRPTLQGLDVPVAAINTTQAPTDVEAMLRYAPSFTVDTIAGVGHAGILHQRVGDFDAKLRAIVARFEGM